MSIETKFNLGDRVRRKPDGLGYEWMKGVIDEIRAYVSLPPFPKKELSYHIRCDDPKKASGFHCWENEDRIEMLTESKVEP